MNLPNMLTLSRVPILFIIVGLLYLRWQGTATLALLLFIFGGITDWLDGYLARKRNSVSDFGKLMDALTDKILIVGMFIAILAVDLVPPWGIICVLLIVSREFLVTGLRLVAASQGTILAAEKTGKQKTVFQIIAISVLLGAPAIHFDFTRWTGWNLNAFETFIYYTGIGFFLFATLLTVYSGGIYIAKYWSLLFPVED